MPNQKKSSPPTRISQKISKSQQKTQKDLDNHKLMLPKPSPNLNHIIEVTEEHDTQRFNTQTIQQVSKLIKKSQISIWNKIFNCFKYIIPCLKKQPQFSIVVKQKQLMKTIQKLRTQNIKCKPFLPPLDSNKKTLVLDIDQTLVFSSQQQIQLYDFTFKMPYKKSDIKVHSKVRFGLESFLFEMSKIYEIVVYTSNISYYVEQILKNIDKKNRISHVLLKDKCLTINKVHFLKSLKALGREPHKVVFIDHNMSSGLLQPKNFLKIRPYQGQKHDRQLVKLLPFLRQLVQKQSVMPVNKHYEQFCNREICLKFNSIDQNKNKRQANLELEDKENDYQERRKSYKQILQAKKKKYNHKRINSQFQNLNTNTQENQKTAIKINLKKISQIQSQYPQQSALELRPRNINAQQSL